MKKKKEILSKQKSNGIKRCVTGSATTLDNVQIMLQEIKKFKALRKFQSEKTGEFCKKYKIKSSQLNFLISVVGAERAKSNGAFK